MAWCDDGWPSPGSDGEQTARCESLRKTMIFALAYPWRMLAKVHLRILANPCESLRNHELRKLAKACETLRNHICEFARKLAKACEIIFAKACEILRNTAKAHLRICAFAIFFSQFYVCFARFTRFLTQILFSTAESSSLHAPHRISTGKTSLCLAGDMGTIPFGVARAMPTPSTPARRAAQRSSFASLQAVPSPSATAASQQAAALCLLEPPSLRPVTVTVRSVRFLQEGTTPLLSVIRRRALATVATCASQYGCPDML